MAKISRFLTKLGDFKLKYFFPTIGKQINVELQFEASGDVALKCYYDITKKYRKNVIFRVKKRKFRLSKNLIDSNTPNNFHKKDFWIGFVLKNRILQHWHP